MNNNEYEKQREYQNKFTEDFDSYRKKYEPLVFRRAKLCERLQRIYESVSGVSASVVPFMRNAFGEYSESAVEELVERLTQAWRVYALYLYPATDTQYGAILDDPYVDEFSEERELAYRAFFYCALRLMYHNDSLKAAGKTFDDLCRLAEKLELYADSDELLHSQYREMLGYDEPENTTLNHLKRIYSDFNTLDELDLRHYLPLNEKDIEHVREALTEEEKQTEREIIETNERLNEIYGDENDFDEDSAQIDATPAKKSRIDEVYKDFARQKKGDAVKRPEQFGNFEIFSDNFAILIRNQHHLGTKEELAQWVKGAVDIFLFDNGLSDFSDSEVFYRSFAVLSRVSGSRRGRKD